MDERWRRQQRLKVIVGGVLAIGCFGFATVYSVIGHPPPQNATHLVQSSGGEVEVNGVVHIGEVLHRAGPRLLVRHAGAPVVLQSLAYDHLPEGLREDSSISYRYADTNHVDASSWFGTEPFGGKVTPARALTGVTVDHTKDPTDWPAMTIVALRPGTYKLSGVTMTYLRGGMAFRQHYEQFGLSFSVK